MEPQQQVYHPELKTEMKQEAPPSFLPLKPHSSRQTDHNSRIERGPLKRIEAVGTSSTERIEGAALLSLLLKRMKMTLMIHLWPLTHITVTCTSKWPETGVVAIH